MPAGSRVKRLNIYVNGHRPELMATGGAQADLPMKAKAVVGVKLSVRLYFIESLLVPVV